MEHLWYAEIIRRLKEVDEALDKACGPCMQLNENNLFAEIYKKRTEVWDLIKKVMKNANSGKATKD